MAPTSRRLIGATGNYNLASRAGRVRVLSCLSSSLDLTLAGKLKCDHALPTCGRCSRRNKPEACIYHPAPLTKARGSSALSALSGLSEPSILPPPPAHPTALSISRTGLVSPPSSSDNTSSDARGFRPSGGVPLSNLMSNTSSPQVSSRDLTFMRRTSSSLGAL